MAKYPLAAMQKVRELHEDQAKSKVKKVEEEVNKAKQALEEQQNELERYKKYRPIEENRRYAEIFGKKLSSKDLGTFREGLAKLAEGEISRMNAVTQCEEILEQTKQKLATAQQELILARKAKLKLAEHRNIWEEAERRESERISDLEMEEARGPSPCSEE